MARGLKKIARIAEESAARQASFNSGDSDFQRALVLKPGQTATGRFCEEGDHVVLADTHELPQKPGQKIADKVLCLNQDESGTPCYACEQGVRRGSRLVMNFIRYDEPKLMRGADGKAIKDNFNNYQYETTFNQATGQQEVVTEPALLVFATGPTAGGRLSYLEDKHNGGDDKHGISNHVVTIHRTTDNTNPYNIDIEHADKAPEPWEIELFQKKVDPLKAITQLGKRSIPAVSYQDMQRIYGGMSVPSGFQGGDAQAAAQTDNPYAQQAASGGHVNASAFTS